MFAFLQVEMFGVTANETGEESDQLLNEFVALQKEIFSSLQLHYRYDRMIRGILFVPFVVILTNVNVAQHSL